MSEEDSAAPTSSKTKGWERAPLMHHSLMGTTTENSLFESSHKGSEDRDHVFCAFMQRNETHKSKLPEDLKPSLMHETEDRQLDI